MYNLIMRLFRFVFPIVKQVVLEAMADEINMAAYPNKRTLRSYRQPIHHKKAWAHLPNEDINAYDRAYSKASGSEIDRPVLLAIEIHGKDMQDRQKKLWEFITTVLEEDDGRPADMQRFKDISGFWIAEDERYHGSEDLDSAVFVRKGSQALSVKNLRQNGLVN